jgi:hypothetical protein
VTRDFLFGLGFYVVLGPSTEIIGAEKIAEPIVIDKLD